MNETKYIIGKNGPILFSPCYSHSDFLKFDPKSAGFVNIRPDFKNPQETFVGCYGESISLDLKSNPDEDAILIKRWILGII